jgi:hypothetical protein
MSKPLTATTILLVGLATAACGSTRFVVVDNPPAGAAGPAATPTTEGGGAAPATDAEREAIEAAIDTALGIDERSFEDRLPALSDADDLEPTFEAVRELVAGLDVEIEVGDVTVSGDEATATTSVVIDGAPFSSDLPVTLVREGGDWKVTRAGACTLLALGSPCPE